MDFELGLELRETKVHCLAEADRGRAPAGQSSPS